MLLAGGDGAVAGGLRTAFADDTVIAAGQALTEPAAFAAVEAAVPDVVAVVPDWSLTGMAAVQEVWWLARAADAADAPLVLLSTAEVLDPDPRQGPRDEFAPARPVTGAGQRAFAAETLVARTTRNGVVVRTGPLDVGAGALGDLVATPGGVQGGGGAVVTPVALVDVAPIVRHLAAGRRPGVYHVAGPQMTLAESARRLGVPAPAFGSRPVPAPLATLLGSFLDIRMPAAWPPAGAAGVPDDEGADDGGPTGRTVAGADHVVER